ncbi:MAG: hypothetical protein HC927_02870 [Deltaproteobacteria bacterium]|nr:hypothetical protein [Deltaproteobacteria bacterium]
MASEQSTSQDPREWPLPWLERGANRAQWRRLVDMLDLNEGFIFIAVLVSSPDLGVAVADGLKQLARGWDYEYVQHAIGSERARPVVSELLRLDPAQPTFALIDAVGSPGERPRLDLLSVAMLQINQRRDVIRARLRGPLVFILDRTSHRAIGMNAPDLWSVRSGEFEFEVGVRVEPWHPRELLLTNYELAGLLGLVPGFIDVEPALIPDYVREPPAPPSPFVGRAPELEQLRVLVQPGAGIIRVRGPTGSGKTSLLAEFVRRHGDAWDQVVWLDSRAGEHVPALLHSLLRSLRPEVAPPRVHADMVRSYRQVTARRRLLVIVDRENPWVDLGWPEPSERSVVVLTGGDDADTEIMVPPMSAEQAAKLWASTAGAPIPGQPRRAWPATIVTLARLPEYVSASTNNPLPHDLNPITSIPRGGAAVVRALMPEHAEHEYELAAILGVARLFDALPTALLADVAGQPRDRVEALFEHLRNHGFRLSDPMFAPFLPEGPRQRSIIIAALRELAEQICAEPCAPLHRGLLRVASQLMTDRDERLSSEAEMLATHPQLIRLLERAQLPCERPDWSVYVADLLSDEAGAALLLRALDELLRLHRVSELDRWASRSRTPTLAHALRHLAVALQLGDPRRVATAMSEVEQLDSSQFAARLDALRAYMKGGDIPEPGSSAPIGQRVAYCIRADRTGDLIGLSPAHDIPDDDPYRITIEHFIHVGRVWHHLRHDEPDAGWTALQRLRESADAWGDPIALLRVDLLEAELHVLTGTLARAAELFDDAQARIAAQFGEYTNTNVGIQVHRMELYERLGDTATALDIAGRMVELLRHVDGTAPSIWAQLAHFHLRHGQDERALLLAERWQAAAQADPASLRKALEFEREVIRRRTDQSLREIDAKLAAVNGVESGDSELE